MLTWVVAAVLQQVAVQAPAQDLTALERCRHESHALNTAKTIATCSAASESAELPVDERVETYKLLGMALILEGEDDLAQSAFEKMLTLDASATLGADAGPNVKKVLRQARDHVRAASADLDGTDGTGGTNSRKKDLVDAATATPPAPADRTVPWAIAGVAAGVAVVSGTLLAGAYYDRYLSFVPCGPTGELRCIPSKPMLFGLYPATRREEFGRDVSSWILGSGLVSVAGVAVAAGASLFALQPGDGAAMAPPGP